MIFFPSKWKLLFQFKSAGLYLLIIFVVLGMTSWYGAKIPLLVSDLSHTYDHPEKISASIMALLFAFIYLFIVRVFYQIFTNLYVRGLLFYLRSFLYQSWVCHRDVVNEKDGDPNDRFPAGEVIARLMNDSQAVKELITSGTFAIVIDLFFVFSALAGLCLMHAKSGFLVFAVELGASIFLIWGSGAMREAFHEVRHARGLISRQIANVGPGLKEGYLNPNYDYASKTGAHAYSEFMNKQLWANVWDSGYYSVAEGLYPIMLALLILFFPMTEVKEAALLLAIIDFIQRSINPIKNIAGKITNIQRAQVGLEKMNEFLKALGKDFGSEKEMDLQINVKAPQNLGHFQLQKMQIDIDSFAYKKSHGAFRLQHIHLQFSPKAKIGLVGESGCGKSTLLQIIAGNCRPTSGTISLFGADEISRFSDQSNEKDFEIYGQLVCLVGQEAHVFQDTLYFNITMGKGTEQEFSVFWHHVCDLIPQLRSWWPDWRMNVMPKNLSHGQKQLMTVLRAFYFKRPVVLYDEIAAGLDSNLEEALRLALQLVQGQSLVMTVAHRLETVMNSDVIILMDKGTVVAKGTHQELLTKEPSYSRFLQELNLNQKEKNIAEIESKG